MHRSFPNAYPLLFTSVFLLLSLGFSACTRSSDASSLETSSNATVVTEEAEIPDIYGSLDNTTMAMTPTANSGSEEGLFAANAGKSMDKRAEPLERLKLDWLGKSRSQLVTAWGIPNMTLSRGSVMRYEDRLLEPNSRRSGAVYIRVDRLNSRIVALGSDLAAVQVAAVDDSETEL